MKNVLDMMIICSVLTEKIWWLLQGA